MKTLIVITGPTAVGKTRLSMEVAMRLGVPIVSADSRQMYRGMAIGTAAPTEAEQRLVKHYFVGTLDVTEYYSASMYEQQAMSLLLGAPPSCPTLLPPAAPPLLRESDYALMSGGSMMYIDAVCNGIDDIPTVDDETRATMKRRLAEEGLEHLCEELRRLDPEHWATVDRKNPRRVVHALEICHVSGRTYTSFRKKDCPPRPFRIVKIGLTLPREELYARINRRTDTMMEQGLLDEARRLMPMRHLNALNTVGYKEMFAYMDGTWTLQEAVERMKGNTRRYARKQLTWLKRDGQMKWFAPDDVEGVMDYVKARSEEEEMTSEQ